MPNLGQFHPQIVHFVIGLLLVGVALRIVSLFTTRLRFASHAAFTLILIGTVAAVLAVKSGTDAHGPVERIPGARALVIDHEGHGKYARNIFLVVALIEIVGVALAARENRAARWVFAASALVGVVGSLQLYEAGEHGGQLVYSYGGGPGLRTGDPRDVERVLLASLYNQATADRRAGNGAAAAELVALMTKRFPDNPDVQVLNAESLLIDKKMPAEAMEALNKVRPQPGNAAAASRTATLRADMLLAMGLKDSAKAILDAAIQANPNSARLKAKRDSIR